MTITRVQIRGLNDDISLDLQLNTQHCILVGPNGSGKSTALQIIALALGRQFAELSTMKFESLTIWWGEVSSAITRRACASFSEGFARRPAERLLADRLRRQNLYEAFLAADLSSREETEAFSSIHIRPSEMVYYQHLLKDPKVRKSAHNEIKAFEKALDEMESPRVSYLPTSRRIEVELAKLFRAAPDYVKEAAMAAFVKSGDSPYFEQIVRFGMDDINAILRGFERKIQEESRNKFNAMLATLLRETANKESISIKELRDRNITEDRISKVLGRIEESTLNQEEVAQIRAVVADLSVRRAGGGNPPFHMKWLAHFFVRLLDVDSELSALEGPVVRLVAALNNYLRPKTIRYDNEKYEISIFSEKDKPIDLALLSSGEKQLVSILTMLELSSQPSLVCIDEPELSLSVPWQLTILEDMVKTRHCVQLFAVTHSPFVYDNTLGASVLDFTDCLVQ